VYELIGEMIWEMKMDKKHGKGLYMLDTIGKALGLFYS